MKRLLWVVLAAATGCGGGGGDPSDEFGVVAGQLRVLTSSAAALSAPTTGRPPTPGDSRPSSPLILREAPELLRLPPDEQVLPGEVLIRFDDAADDPELALKRTAQTGWVGTHAGWAASDIHLLRFRHEDGRPVDAEQTRALSQTLSGLPGVSWTALNRVHHPLATPDDVFFPRQWHYATFNLPAAWDLATDSPGVVVAVVDTGIVEHPDLRSRLLPGVDVISDPLVAGDGDGRDMDPNDEGGDLPGGESSWHGTHVAGTVGAESNNRVGVAGVSWNARVLPIRALGRNGGSTADVLAGIAWAMGEELPGLERNLNPAQVINLSIGTVGEPDAAYQALIDRGVAQGVVFVVAAGNESVSTVDRVPCNQQNVICVGATRLNGTRASYSNFGPEIDVMAPGGDGLQDLNADELPDAVLSTYFDEARTPAYAFLQGTSMAAPHVSGLVALMKSLDPALPPDALESILRETASPALVCTEGCGAGLVNAQTALARAAGQVGLRGPGALFVPTQELLLSDFAPTPLLLINTGGAPLEVNASFGAPQTGVTLEFPQGAGFQIPAGQAITVPVAVSAADGIEPGEYPGSLTFAPVGADEVSIPVRLRVGAFSADATAFVSVLTRNADGNWVVVAATPAFAEDGYQYSIGVAPGVYYVAAAIDDNGNGSLFEPGERGGFYPSPEEPTPITVRAGETIEGIDFPLQPLD